MSSSLQLELQFLSKLLVNHPRLIVTCSEDYFRIEVKTNPSRIFSVEIPKEYPFSDLLWHKPFLPKQLNLTEGQYKHSLSPLSAGVYEILTFYSHKLQLHSHTSELKRYLDRQETELVPSSPILHHPIFDSFEEIPDSNSISDDFEPLELPPSSIEELELPPSSIEEIESLSCSEDTEGSDGYESDDTVIGEDEYILDSVMVIDPEVKPKPLIIASLLESFGMSSESARALMQTASNSLSHLRLCTELSYIRDSNQYNTSTASLHLRVLEDDIHKWELKIWEFPEPCHLNTELLHYSPTDSCVTLEITFPPEYPFLPPFLRIVSPPIRAGHVIMGGAIFLDILLPQSCELLASPRAYSVSTQMIDLFTQVVYSMVDGNAHVLNSPDLLDTYTYAKAHFVYHSIIELTSVDWGLIVKNVMNTERENRTQIGGLALDMSNPEGSVSNRRYSSCRTLYDRTF